MLWRLSVVVLLLQVGATTQLDPQDFVINSSNPYVYLKLDHVGPRKPAVVGEPALGAWIAVVNNCRIPILVPTITTDAGVDGITVLDQIVTYGAGIVSEANKIEPEPLDGKDTSRATADHPKAPAGYDKFSSDLPGFKRILPGASLLFSVPINHVVGDDWYMRVRFSLDLPNSKSGPYSYADSFTIHVPAEYLQGRHATH
jgi:hypothetical protein